MDQLGRMSKEEFRQIGKIPVIIVLDNIRSGLNVGSIFRSADAFLIKKIYCCGYTSCPPHREVLKSALGATETVDWEYKNSTGELIAELKNTGVKCYAMEQTTNSIPTEEFESGRETLAIILGNEVNGVEQNVIDLCDGSLEIKQFGSKHSLNVAVCAGIIMYELSKKYLK